MNQTTAIIGIFSCALGIVVGAWLFSDTTTNTETVRDVEIRLDTIVHEIHHEPVIIQHAKADTVIRLQTDTVYRTTAFVSKIDTVIHRDTVHAEYAFPQHTFSVALRQSPDSVQYVTKEVFITKHRATPWFEYVGSALAGVAVGYVVRGN